MALAVVAGDPFPMLATVGHAQPRVRPVSPVRTEGFTVCVASMRRSANPEYHDVRGIRS